MLGIVLMSSLGLGLGCKQSGGGKPRESTIKAEELKDQGKTKEAAEVYSRMGQLLLSRPEGVAHAKVMFQKALEINKSDAKLENL